MVHRAYRVIVCLGFGSGALGCGPEQASGLSGSETESPGDGDGDADAGDGDGDGDDDAGDGDGDDGAGDGDGEPGDGDGEPGDGDGDPAPPECLPPGDAEVEFSVTPPESLQATCSLIGESFDNGGEYEMWLDCEGSEVQIAVTSTSPYAPSPAGEMLLDYRVEGEEQWLALRSANFGGALLFGAVSATRLDPPGTTLAELFVDPMLRVAEEQPCEVFQAPCGSARRLALEIEFEQFGSGGYVFDSESWYTNFLAFGYTIEVERALDYLEPGDCGAVGAVELVATGFSDP